MRPGDFGDAAPRFRDSEGLEDREAIRLGNYGVPALDRFGTVAL